MLSFNGLAVVNLLYLLLWLLRLNHFKNLLPNTTHLSFILVLWDELNIDRRVKGALWLINIGGLRIGRLHVILPRLHIVLLEKVDLDILSLCWIHILLSWNWLR